MNKRKPHIRLGYIAYYNTITNNYDYEHDIVMGKLLNHKLKANEVVHHLDGNKCNNNPENLIYLENSQHTKLHKWISDGCFVNKKNFSNVESALNESRRCTRKDCNNIIKDKRNIYCSIECRQKDIGHGDPIIRPKRLRDINKNKPQVWPDIEHIVASVNNKGYVATAKDIGVSDKAIANRLKKFNRFKDIVDFRKNK